MASGGCAPSSEPRKRAAAYCVDSEELSSLGSSRQEDRPNNWDFSDWRPTATFDSGKRIKKGNNPDREKENKREREQLSKAKDVSRSEPSRQRTPSTFPRTKMSRATPMSQRIAMENLRQHLSFSETEEVSADGERNNERYLAQRERLSKYMSQTAVPTTRNETTSTTSEQQRDRNSNISKEEGPNSNEIVGRLMQIRDYIKQASAMMDNLKKSPDPGDHGRAKQLDQVIQRLKEQEQKYLDLLLKLSKGKEPYTKLDNLMHHLQQQEKDYLKLLEKCLTAREDEVLFAQNMTVPAVSSQPESETEAESVELDVQSDTSGNTTDGNEEEEEVVHQSRPCIEDRLGRHSDTEAEDPPSARSSRSKESELDNTLVAEADAEHVMQHSTLAELAERRTRLETDLGQKNDELEALRQQHDLLKKMLYEQEQLRALQGRQAALQALQRDAERNISDERSHVSEAGATGASNVEAAAAAASVSVGNDGAADSQMDGDVVPQELKDLRRRLDYLKNIYDIQDQDSEREEYRSVTTEQSEESMTSIQRRHLSDKLHDLQDKKHYMDDLLQELHTLRRQRHPHLNSEPDTQSITSSQGHILESITATASANKTATEAEDVLEMLESRKKLKKLKDVRGRLNQLRDLVQYYQTGTEFIHGTAFTGDTEEQSSLPDYDDQPSSRNPRAVSKKEQVVQKLHRYGGAKLTSREVTSDDVSTQDDNTDTESQASSSVSGWGDDPEIQDKVRKLKAAKDKLRQLQDLVAMVQQSPDIANSLPDDLAELAISLGGETMSQASHASQVSARPDQTSLSEGEVPKDSSEAYYEARMQEQREELEQLMDERRKLLGIQDQLTKLHQQLPGGEPSARRSELCVKAQEDQDEESQEEEEQVEKRDVNNTRVKTVTETSQVTFQDPPEVVQSYDELYGQMRQQRMLREELREKKKELEIMMRKDRPRKQYSRNQDTQSDNISFSNKSDPFGTKSEDVTMATWGGSTADNLESIEEDEDGSGAGQGGDEEPDDGYPSDGIIQVEEEEEAQESDDHDTYTIEDDYGPRGRQQQPSKPPAVEQRPTRGRRRKGRRGAPLMTQHEDDRRQYEYNYWAPDKNVVLNNARSRVRRPRNERPDGGLQQEVRDLRQELEETRAQMTALQSGSPLPLSASSFPPTNSPNGLLIAQMQQQQLLLNLSQNYQQLCMNQHDSSDRLRRLENHLMHEGSVDDILSAARRDHLTSYRSNSSFTHSPLGPNPYRMTPAPEVQLQYPPQIAPQITATSTLDADSYLQQFRARRSRDFPLTQPPDGQFNLDPRPCGFESESLAFLNNPAAYAASQGYVLGDGQQQQQSVQNRVVQTDEVLTDVLGVNSETSAPNSGAIPKRGQMTRRQQEQGQLSQRSDGTTRSQSEVIPPDDIQIDTIHAADTGRIPRLDLEKILRARPKTARYPIKEIAAEVSTVASSRSDAVIGRKFPTPSRASAASRLASRQIPAGLRPGISAGISGTAFMDGSSMASVSTAVSSVPGAGSVDIVARSTSTPGTRITVGPSNPEQESDATMSDFTLFEALRETIYAEVATLISQNETRPHFLIELFRELQMLSSDYLRQRALYAIQDLVTRHLTEEDVPAKQPDTVQAQTGSASRWQRSPGLMSENTPSESLMTSEDDEVKAQLYAQNPHLRASDINSADQGSMSGSVKSDRFDYAEAVDTTSSLSTPTSSNYWDHDHFSKDSLGDTVIHLDKALQRMREYEQHLAEADSEEAHNASIGLGPEPSRALNSQRVKVEGAASNSSAAAKQELSEAASSSAQGSDTSTSDVPDDCSSVSGVSYPRIDTQQLDRQIKGIMTEIIPALNEHKDEVCSEHLLQYVRRLVLSMTKHRDDQHEFARFFHKQLGSIVQDSLAKFEGRKMRDCLEDMLVELSEILFNELAFFRLMQDLDDPKAKVKARVREWHRSGADSQTSTETGPTRDDDDNLEIDEGDDDHVGEDTTSQATTSSESDMSEVDHDEDGSCEVDDASEQPDEDEDPKEDGSGFSDNETEDLGKARDDELANQVEISEKDDDSESPHKSPVKIELAVSEMKSFTRIGSDEDDEGEDEEHSADDVSETAVSRDIHNEAESPTPSNKPSESWPPQAVPEPGSAGPKVDDGNSSEMSADKASGSVPAEQEQSSPQIGAVMNGEVEDAAEDAELVTIDDLPPKLTGLGNEQAGELEEKVSIEEQQNSGVAAALEILDGTGAELAGDPAAVKEPGS